MWLRRRIAARCLRVQLLLLLSHLQTTWTKRRMKSPAHLSRMDHHPNHDPPSFPLLPLPSACHALSISPSPVIHFVSPQFSGFEDALVPSLSQYNTYQTDCSHYLLFHRLPYAKNFLQCKILCCSDYVCSWAYSLLDTSNILPRHYRLYTIYILTIMNSTKKRTSC